MMDLMIPSDEVVCLKCPHCHFGLKMLHKHEEDSVHTPLCGCLYDELS